MAIQAKREQKCACGYPIVKGQEILFERASGRWVHKECYKSVKNEDQQKLF